MSKVATNPENLLARLKQAQDRLGYLPEECLAEVARSLNMPLSEVYGVATFYSFLSTRPLGRNVIRVCKSLPCYLKNSRMIVESIEDKLGIRPGGTTPDGRFSLALVNCIGACDIAPAMLINHDVHGDLTPRKISRILQSYE
ncbi:MAG: NADH-quinone oxidoreductase subunit NuoE [Chloroflexota bacterium]|nr:NADH-quinone oxidoreductase subunit NuoE [Chloroflexota bacterium]